MADKIKQLLNEIKFQELKYEELSRSWYSLRNKLQIATEALENIDKELCKNCEWNGTGCDPDCIPQKIKKALERIKEC